MVQKDKISNFLQLAIRSRVICHVSAYVELQKWARLHHKLVKVINLSRNVQVSCPLLELSSGHVVVFQVKVPQISLIRQVIHDVAKSFTVWISAQYRDLLLITHPSFLTHLCSSVADGSRQTGGPFHLRNGVGVLRSAADPRFSFVELVLDERCSSSSSSETVKRSGHTTGLSSSSSSSSLVSWIW